MLKRIKERNIVIMIANGKSCIVSKIDIISASHTSIERNHYWNRPVTYPIHVCICGLCVCLMQHVDELGILPECQCGFHTGCGTTNMIFSAHQLQEKCLEQYKDLYLIFVDLTKALTP